MAKTRLLVSDREAIRKAIIAHKFRPICNALDIQEAALAEEARRIAYKDYLATMEAAPEGAFPTDDDVTLSISGRKIILNFSPGAEYNKRVKRRLFSKHTGYEGRVLSIYEDDEYGARVLAYATAREQARKDRDHLTSVTDGTLEAFRTFDDLLTAWPEAERFIKDRWQTRPEYTANVPAIVIKDLSAQLDLPPELAEAA